MFLLYKLIALTLLTSLLLPSVVPTVPKYNLQPLHFQQGIQGDELPPHKTKLRVAQHRWTNVPEGEEISPSPCVSGGHGLKMMLPALFLEDAGMQSLQRKGAVWHRCTAAEALPSAKCKNSCWHCCTCENRGAAWSWASRRLQRRAGGGGMLLVGCFATFFLSICKVCYIKCLVLGPRIRPCLLFLFC